METLFFLALCLAGLCAAPLRLDIQGGPLRLGFRYLWLRGSISPALRRGLRRRARRILLSGDFSGAVETYGPLFRKPLGLRRFRVKATFSAGDAAETALLHGGLCLFAGLFSSLPGRAKIVLEPCFSSGEKLSLDCDISVSVPAAVFLYRVIAVSIREKRSPHV
jgi:hypothetical protein